MKKILLLLMVGSLFGGIGIGFHIQSVPKISIPIRFKKMIIEPSIQHYMTKQKASGGYVNDYYEWLNDESLHTQDSDQITTVENIVSLGFYKKINIADKFQILGGCALGGRLKKTVYKERTDKELIRTLLTFNVGIEYQLNDYCDLAYELVPEYYFVGGINNGWAELNSKFIIRLYKP